MQPELALGVVLTVASLRSDVFLRAALVWPALQEERWQRWLPVPRMTVQLAPADCRRI